MRVTDLEKFTLEHIYNPYLSTLFDTDMPRMKRLSADFGVDSAVAHLDAHKEWRKLVMDRILDIGVIFPHWIQHPLVDYIERYRKLEYRKNSV